MKQSRKFRHVILTRYNNGIYDREDATEWMKDRFELFKATRESVLSQEGDFEWVISFDERTPDSYVTKCLTDSRMKATCRDVRDFFEGLEVDTPWVITTRIDNDDLYLPGAIKAIQEQFAPQIIAIDIDYFQLDLRDGKKYTSERYTCTSPFISLVEPSNRVKTVYCRPHNKLYDGYPISDSEKKAIPGIKIRKQLAYMVIHHDNMANKIVGKEIL